ncbi:LLM class flavin-dependent oxidoreductase [Rhodococcus opacus]|jgi:luciferase family oxidoreductase group 1|uniref:LLM class flavin-dependent oxidoreductase n=1 Tax=Rhodococcus opacus TaxID=37919 RepID=A0A2S8J8T0_RHOOP|nr:LLM class flavin-dependent oxidoreductase [Rhodococcus opacus]MCZ4590403.1 LLM class flavin-dependent oxidoreductase [Rhodococcus opacus]PQP23470.1 LLM class flavin-dependent oxidoreductase [Rhodococcus opacus]WLF52269.1 LLM class flavin-dependent oxidoreductase [Rhodococcus opacus]
MQFGQPSGTAPFVLSVLAIGSTGVGVTASEGLAHTIALAQTADRTGYHRFWMSEHHAMPAASIAAPQLMVARLVGETARIRLGAGGIMLPNHAPLMVAEQFGMLEALAPGRIDLGLGRAPGTDGATAAALRRGEDANDHFPQHVVELMGFLDDDFPAGHRYRGIHAVPGPWQAAQNRIDGALSGPDVWILGSSPYSALLAAQLGRPYAFALQFGDADVATAVRLYRENFRPSDVLDRPYVLVSVPVAVAENHEEARRHASTSAMAMLRMFQRKGYQLLTADEVEAYPATSREQSIIDDYTHRSFHGTPAVVADRLMQLYERTGADELMLAVGGHSNTFDRNAIELIADYFGLPASTSAAPSVGG